MTPKPTGWDELHLAETPAIQLLESLGYTYVPPEDLEPERASLKETILARRLAAALKRLNPWLSDANVAKAVKAVTQVPAASLAEANEKVYTSLTYGIALEQDRGGGRKSHTVRFFDFDRPERNEWVVTRQYRVLGSKKQVILDIVAFVNGLPLAVIECKSPNHRGRVEGRGGQAAPALSGGGYALEGPGGAAAVRGGAGSRRDVRRARRLRHGGNAGAVLPGMEGAVSAQRGAARRATRARADAAGRPALRVA